MSIWLVCDIQFEKGRDCCRQLLYVFILFSPFTFILAANFVRLLDWFFVCWLLFFFSFLSRPFHTFLSRLLIVILNLRFVLLNDKLTFKRLNGHWKRLSNWIYRCQYTSIYSAKVTCDETRLKQKNNMDQKALMKNDAGKYKDYCSSDECHTWEIRYKTFRCNWMLLVNDKKRVFNEMPTQRTWM